MVKLTEEQKKVIISKERERRRLLRLKEVREQAAVHARVIREAVKQKKQQVVEDLRTELHIEIEAKIKDLTKNGPLIATAHDSQRQTSNIDLTRRRSKSKNGRRKRHITLEDLEVAKKRSQLALKKLRDSKNQEREKREQRIELRRKADIDATKSMRGIPLQEPDDEEENAEKEQEEGQKGDEVSRS